jgi:hypothetical protein
MTETVVLRTRPTTCEAKRLTEDNREELARWTRGWTYGVSEVRWFRKDGKVDLARVGEWIVRTAFGEHVPATDAVLAREYERPVTVVAE